MCTKFSILRRTDDFPCKLNSARDRCFDVNTRESQACFRCSDALFLARSQDLILLLIRVHLQYYDSEDMHNEYLL